MLTLIVVGKLFMLQIIEHGYYSALAAVQHNVSSVLFAERGRILVRDNGQNGSQESMYYPVAINKKVENLVVSPKDIDNTEEVAKILSDIVRIEKAEILNVLSQKERRYSVLKKDLSAEEINLVTEAKKNETLPKLGVWLESETKRYYPEGTLLAHTLGFVSFTQDTKKAGIYGLEKHFDDELAGKQGYLDAPVDAVGRPVIGEFRKLVPAVNGSTVVLTIDRAIQVQAERVLKSYVERFGAEGGQVIVANPKTGAIMALAAEPTFNPNEFNKVEDVKVFSNPAVQARYEPGSIMKPITMAAALDRAKVKPDDTYKDTGQVVIGGSVIKNSDEKSYGQQSMVQVLEKSLNTGIVYVQQKAGKEILKDYLREFGFSEKTGLTLPGEITGDLRNLNTNSDIAFATAAFGQGISATPMELIQAYTAIASDGRMKKLHLISEIQKPDGSREVVEPDILERVISEATAAKLSSMLVNVVENGHGKRAKVPGFYIAGKTGTAQVPLEDRRGYDPDKSIGSFIGYGPVENPAFVMLVRIDNPKGVKFAESTAAPAFGEIAKFVLEYLQIPPTRNLE